MELKFQRHCFISSSSSNSLFPQKPIRIHLKVVDLEHLHYNWGNWRKRCLKRDVVLENTSHRFSCRVIGFRKHCTTTPRRSRRTMKNLIPCASPDDVTVNRTPQASTSTDDVEEMRAKLNQSLQGEDHSDGLVHFLHDAARVFELAIKEQSSISKISWFSTAWLGVDTNAWVKALSYKASVYSLLQAASEISSRGEGRDRDINVSVQRSLSRQSAPLESVIRDEFSAKQPEAYEWFWSEQVPMVATTFVNYFERDPRFTAATAVSGKGMGSGSGKAGDISLLMLALTCLAAITKLGPAKISSSQFFSMVPDVTGRLMDMLVDFIPMSQAYHFMKDIGLRREFLVHFGPRAADCRVKNDRGTEEVIFWVDIIQQQLQRAIDRERIWSRLTTCESIEVLERDLAIFGFFIALGRSTQSFLSANGFDTIDSPIEGLIRYLIGGSVLYYPPLSSISSYQFYVEVVCEEVDWIPFYPGIVGAPKPSHGHNNKQKGPPNPEAIPQVLDVCSYWMQNFIKYSKWLDKPANVKAARFLSRGHNKLQECIEELGMSKIETDTKKSVENTVFLTYSPAKKVPDSFDKALESVEEALIRLEELLQELHVSNSCCGKEQLKAACSDLEKIRKLKKEAEFLEASFRAKADSLQQGANDGVSQTSIDEPRPYSKGKNRNAMSDRSIRFDRAISNPRGLWSFLVPRPTRKLGPESSTKNEPFEATTSAREGADAESSEIRRFELLRNELMELEIRVQRSADQSENDEDITIPEEAASYSDDTREAQLVQIQKKENIIEKSFDKLKETTTDVWQGTQLLAIDVAASTGLLRRVLIGDDLTEREKKALQRTLTDLASVVPIGILMLLPVTAVGHAAILAAIQRYVPALIPSTYGPERLDLLRQLEKVKEMETSEVTPDENAENIPSL